MIATENILKLAVLQAMETMAFLTEMPMEEDMEIPQECILAQIDFKGPESGTIQILAGRNFAQTLAENMGAIDDVDDEICTDAMKELTNVISGLLLPLIASSGKDVFDITVPYIKSGNDAPQWEQFTANDSKCVLNIEGNLIAVNLNCQQ